jgi:hypothetical protein
LPASSALAVVDYFRCDRCGAVWVIDEVRCEARQLTPTTSNRLRPAVMFLQVDTEAGLLFARMAQATSDFDKRRALRMKAQRTYDVVRQLTDVVKMSDAERARAHRGLEALQTALADIPA